MGRVVLVTGVSGLLGSYMARALQMRGDTVYGTWYTNPTCSTQCDGLFCLDIRDTDAVYHILDNIRPDVVVHTAAVGSVDYCEKHYDSAYAVNVDSMKGIVRAADDYHCELMYVSSNAVFRGDQPPYGRCSEVNPVNLYGRMKVEAERIVREYRSCGFRDYIVRPIMLYGWHANGGRDNWVTRTLRCMHIGMKLRMVVDVRTQPTYAADCAEAMCRLLDKKLCGAWNIGGLDVVSMYDYVKTILESYKLYDKYDLLESMDSRDAGLARRPTDTSYDTNELKEAIDYTPRGLWEGLEAMKSEHSY